MSRFNLIREGRQAKVRGKGRPAMRRVIVVVLILAVALVGGGCGKSSSSSSASSSGAQVAQTATSTTKFAKTKFALHAGLAFGAFHRYIYKPLKAGDFSGGLFHHKVATVKAALAAAFVYHEVGLALTDARSSKLLSKALAPLLAIQSKLGGLRSGLKHGTADAAAIESVNGSATQVSAAGAAAGQPVNDLATSDLGG